jgi:lipopolysaccharide transport system ATP-binding protein
MTIEPGSVVVEGLSKRYALYERPWHRLVDWLAEGHSRYRQEVWPLRDLSFRVRRGESVGIIGLNGAGKSTLLKLLAGVLTPSAGRAEVGGSALALLELGAGFHPELSGRENVRNLGRLLDFPKGYAEARMAEILAFADIGAFIDDPVRIYSSGMLIRLAFATYLFFAPDVLIVDEALAVGDIFFQQKCYGAMRERIRRGTTLLFVSHDMGAVRAMCSRAILLKAGSIDFDGSTDAAIGRYIVETGRALEPDAPPTFQAREPALAAEPAAAALLREGSLIAPAPRGDAPSFEIAAVRFVDAAGAACRRVPALGRLAIEALLLVRERVERPNLGFELYDSAGGLVFSTSFLHLGRPLPPLAAGSSAIVRFKLQFAVRPGLYTLAMDSGELAGAPHPNMAFVRDRRNGLGPIEVTAGEGLLPFTGAVRLPCEVTIESVTAG